MELTRENFSLTYYDFQLDLSRRECIDQLTSLLNNVDVPHLVTVQRLCNEFQRGRRFLQDEFREGRPKIVVVPETIDVESELIIPHHEKQTSLNINGTSIHLFTFDTAYFVNRLKKDSCRLEEN